jgi:DNA-binding MarR family transcriptional regulator
MTSPVSVLGNFGTLRRSLSLLAHRHFGKIGLNNQQVLILRFLAKHSELSVTELSMKAKSDQASISRTLISLEKCGFVSRGKSSADARVIASKLTIKGKRKSRELKAVYKAFADMAFKGLSQNERDNFQKILNSLNSRIEKFI